jgi:tetratricopeptide (TPR) repeat protein
MGLLDEAISEFQMALRADGRHLPTYEVLGEAFLDKGEPQATIRALDRAVRIPHDVEDELLGIYYYLGRAHEELGNRDSAREFYERTFALDINFRDVTERLRQLR